MIITIIKNLMIVIPVYSSFSGLKNTFIKNEIVNNVPYTFTFGYITTHNAIPRPWVNPTLYISAYTSYG